jgi:hypothetical protein
MCLARGGSLRLRLVPHWGNWVRGVGLRLALGVVGTAEVANAVVVAGYWGMLQGVS